MIDIKSVTLTDIPVALLPVIGSRKYGTLWLNGLIVERITIFREMQYRILTTKGEYRYPLDTDLSLEVQPH